MPRRTGLSGHTFDRLCGENGQYPRAGKSGDELNLFDGPWDGA